MNIKSRILHKKAIYKIIGILITLGTLFGVTFLLFNEKKSDIAFVVSGSKKIFVTVADTPLLREFGLSGSKKLPVHNGKLFVFDHPDRYGFWMKDMQYPLDIVWIDRDLQVISIDTIYPESYPKIFYPPSNVVYVLEINAHEAISDGLYIGARIQFNK